MNNTKKRTLVLLKPDTVARGIMGDVISRFERAGLKLVGMKMIAPGEDHYHEHYEVIGTVISRHGKEVFDKLMDTMMSGPVVAMVLEGISAVELVRKMVGTTEPHSAQPGTIRGDFAHMSYDHADQHDIGVLNIVHASGDEKEAALEIALWFSPEEIFQYTTVHEKYVATTKGQVTRDQR